MGKVFLFVIFAVCICVTSSIAADTSANQIIPLLGSNGQGKVELLVGAGEADLERAEQPGALDNSINAFLVKMNGKSYLFDTGLPNGTIVASLKKAGVEPENIDAVFITHFHGDHIGGLLDDGKAVYPNAELYVPKVEVDNWFDRGTEFLSVYGGRAVAFDWDKEIVSGITGLDASGHTPGHTVYRLETPGGKLLIIADLIHFGGVQLPNPDVAVTYDVDPVMAVEARKRIFSQAAAEGVTVASMHLPYPGVGVLKRDGNGYVFEK